MVGPLFVLFLPGLAAGFSITSLAFWARCAVSGRHAFVRQGSLKDLRPQSAFAWGLQADHLFWQRSKAAPMPPLVGLYSCLHCHFGDVVALLSRGLAFLASPGLLFPLKRNHQPVFNEAWCKAAGELSFLVQSSLLGALQGGCRTTPGTMHTFYRLEHCKITQPD